MRGESSLEATGIPELPQLWIEAGALIHLALHLGGLRQDTTSAKYEYNCAFEIASQWKNLSRMALLQFCQHQHKDLF